MRKNHDLDQLAHLYEWPEPSLGLEARIINAARIPLIDKESFFDRLVDVFSFKWEPAVAMALVLLLGLSLGQFNSEQSAESYQRSGLYQDSNFYFAESIVNDMGES